MIDSVKIGTVVYDVQDDVENLHDFSGDQRIALWGHYKVDTSEILIANQLGPQQKVRVLWHEILHGVMSHAGIDDQSEQLIEVLAYGIVDLLRNNPDLVKLTLGNEKQ